MPRSAALLFLVVLSGLIPLGAQSCSEGVCIETVQEGTRVEFFVHSTREQTVRVDFTLTLENMRLDQPEPISVVVEPGQRLLAFTAAQQEASKPWRYRYRFTWRIERGSTVMSSSDSLVVMHVHHRPDSIYYEAENRAPTPVVVGIGLSAGLPSADRIVGLDVGERAAMGARARSDERRSFTYRFAPGVVDAQPDTSVVYRLPVASGTPVTATRTYAGAGPVYLFAVPPETPVLAARAGIVFDVAPLPEVLSAHAYRMVPQEVVEVDGGRRLRRAARGFVSIVHDDGTVATYEGIDPTTLAVGRGERVEVGHRLGQTGRPRDYAVPEAETGTRTIMRPLQLADYVEAGERVPEGVPDILSFQLYAQQGNFRPFLYAPLFQTQHGPTRIQKDQQYTAPAP